MISPVFLKKDVFFSKKQIHTNTISYLKLKDYKFCNVQKKLINSGVYEITRGYNTFDKLTIFLKLMLY